MVSNSASLPLARDPCLAPPPLSEEASVSPPPDQCVGTPVPTSWCEEWAGTVPANPP